MNTKINYKIFAKFPELESERLLFRKFTKADIDDLFYIRTDSEVMKFMDVYPMRSLRDAEKMIASVNDSFKRKLGINWVIIEKSSGKFAGYFGFWRIIPEHCRAEIGYALKPEFWNNGFMTETIKLMIRFAFLELQVHSVEANVNPYNKNSIRVLEKNGFKKEAHFRENFLHERKFHDSLIYTLLEGDFIEFLLSENS